MLKGCSIFLAMWTRKLQMKSARTRGWEREVICGLMREATPLSSVASFCFVGSRTSVIGWISKLVSIYSRNQGNPGTSVLNGACTTLSLRLVTMWSNLKLTWYQSSDLSLGMRICIDAPILVCNALLNSTLLCICSDRSLSDRIQRKRRL